MCVACFCATRFGHVLGLMGDLLICLMAFIVFWVCSVANNAFLLVKLLKNVRKWLAKLLEAYRLIELTLGTLSESHMPSFTKRSFISHANIVGFWCLYSAMACMTVGVATFGFDPPMTPGLIEPVS